MTHHICTAMRELRKAAGLSLADVEEQKGIGAIVLGSYERGDRIPPLTKAEHILNQYGYTLAAVPIDASAIRLPKNMAAELRAIADQLEGKNALSDVSPEWSCSA